MPVTTKFFDKTWEELISLSSSMTFSLSSDSLEESPPLRVPKPKQVLDLCGYSYMSRAHNPEELIRVVREVIPKGLEFDTFVGTGLSGTIAATVLAKELDKHYLIIRKENDGSHAGSQAEGRLGKRWLFIDDLVSSGATLHRVATAVRNLAEGNNFETENLGAVLYQGMGSWYDPKEFSRIDKRYKTRLDELAAATRSPLGW